MTYSVHVEGGGVFGSLFMKNRITVSRKFQFVIFHDILVVSYKITYA